MTANISETMSIASVTLGNIKKIIAEELTLTQDKSIDRILKYQVERSGQLLRPFLAYISAMATNADMDPKQMEMLEYFAASIELLHNASLLHDDVLDNEEERRGSPCLYKAFGPRNAILSGNIYYINAI
ncbi:MAG: hypothetical protein HGA22_03030, partial [Clostridiales bacterium]|nr:hypothetical protein [Clostridiales bacterium]